MLPFGDWRGTFVGGTTAQGVKLPCDATYCLVAWPGKRYRAFLERDRSVHQQNFFGSLTTGQENSNGLMYMRNRYYNPLTGAFTQTDPIGLAGGLNTYGYAEGNPVSYADPYGLAACPNAPEGDPRRGPDLEDCTGSEIQRLMGFVRRETAHDMVLAGGVVGGFRSLLGWIGRRLGREAADAVDDPTGPQSQYDDSITQANSVRNVQTDVSRSDFESVLDANGWSRTGSKDGKVMIYTRDGARYVVRDNARSTGGPTADYYSPGSRVIDLKLRLKP